MTTSEDTATDPAADTPAPFSVEHFLGLPRVGGLAVSPDGTRLVTGVATRHPDGTRFAAAVWGIDTAGADAPVRLTRSGTGEASPAFLANGDLLFTSARPDPDTPDDTDERPRLWLLPAAGGEARCIAAPAAGVQSVATSRDGRVAVIATAVLPDAVDWDADAEAWKARTDAKVTAQLIDHYPMRFWDRWIGPRQRRLFAAVIPTDDSAPVWHDLLPDAGWTLEEQGVDVSADGSTVVTSVWEFGDDARDTVTQLVRIDLGDDAAPTGTRRLTEGHRVGYGAPALSPDGTQVLAERDAQGSPDGPMHVGTVIIDAASGDVAEVALGLDRWMNGPGTWIDDDTVAMTVDHDGGSAIVVIDAGSGEARFLTERGHHSSVIATADGSALYAVRSSIDAPPHVVRIDPTSGEATSLPSPGDDITVPHAVERVETLANDGQRVPGWLILPEGASPADPAPLAVFIHGGPVASWHHWNWRWNPHLFAARGWAVLMPDPALSTGYGRDYVARGWGRWGAEPYTDIMSLVDATEARDDVDATRTAALGGSFGGYMANWVAGHTDRFDAIVTHASLWDLEAFHGTTDLGPWWENEFGDAYSDASRYREWSPHRFVDAITTPMLVIHGEKDYRVPVGEGLALWTDLRRHNKVAQYLHFPDENHWILKPQHTAVWYDAIFAFCEHHALGTEARRPTHL